ncbi:MAG: Hsp20/alpha crystallin family protein [Patescibacteria group bacterium]|nr:Hsp20/alpha crystallin family protein [Patescibacteria group bacterium]
MNDEQFFENLAGGSTAKNTEETAEPDEEIQETAAEPEYETELAKASTLQTRAKSSRPKLVETDDEKTWDDTEPAGELTVDVFQTPGEIVIESAIAGVKPEDIDIQVTHESIAIKGLRHRTREVDDENYLCQECYWGKFARTIIFPEEVNPDGASVGFKNGILTIRLPKANKRKVKNLKVRLD